MVLYCMKANIITSTLILCALLLSCQSVDQGDLERIFINKDFVDEPGKPDVKTYGTKALTRAEIYDAVFDENSPLRPFNREDSKDATIEYFDNSLYIRAKSYNLKPVLIRPELPLYTLHSNFEVETDFTSNYTFWKGSREGGVGLILNRHNNLPGYAVYVNHGVNTEIVIQHLDPHMMKLVTIFKQKIDEDLSDECLFTIRKYEDEIIFYLNKKQVFSESYTVTKGTTPVIAFFIPSVSGTFGRLSSLRISELILKEPPVEN